MVSTMSDDLDEETLLLESFGRIGCSSSLGKGYRSTSGGNNHEGCGTIDAADAEHLNPDNETVHQVHKPIRGFMAVLSVCLVLVIVTLFNPAMGVRGFRAYSIHHLFEGFQVTYQPRSQHLFSDKQHNKNGHTVRLSKSKVDSNEGRNNIASLDGVEADCGTSPMMRIEFKASGGSGGKGWFAYSCNEMDPSLISPLIRRETRRTYSTTAGDIMTLGQQKIICPDYSFLSAVRAHQDFSSIFNVSKFYLNISVIITWPLQDHVLKCALDLGVLGWT